MENSIVKEFQNLHVLKTYDFEKMDELVQDLTNALEETARPQKSKYYENTYARRQYKKKKARKRRTNGGGKDGGNLSEASESSLDEALKDYMENVFQQSDSDEVATAHRLSSLPLSTLSHALSLAESDSVTENFSPMKLHRRKRKCKRMAVDPQPDPDFLLPTLKPKFTRIKSKIKTLETRTDNVMETNSTEASNSEGTCGQNAVSSEGCGNSMETNYAANNPLDVSSSSLSSSESDCGTIGLFTNDEGRDGDDEQSDFFHEAGPSCGIPGIIAWWENEKCSEHSSNLEPKFHNFIKGSFDYMSEAGQKSFKARVTKLLAGREFRSARRRFKEKNQRYSRLRCKQQSSTEIVHNEDWPGTMSPPAQSDIKRRRRTPPSTPAKEGYVGIDAEPIPESNVGQKMLQSMGWIPGTGLGPTNSGITTPVMAYVRQKRKGLGVNSEH